MGKKRQPAVRQDAQKLAPGLDGVEGLDEAASPEDIQQGNYTEVIKLEYDEYDASEP